MTIRIMGNKMKPETQKEALARYIHRYTKDHIPAWANGTDYPVQFESDDEWLANTEFKVNKSGTLYKRVSSCLSHPTWPDNPELRK